MPQSEFNIDNDREQRIDPGMWIENNSVIR